MAKSVAVYRDLAPLVRVAGFTIWAQVVVSGVSLVFDALHFQQRAALAGLNLSQEDLNQQMVWSDLLQGVVALALMVVTIVAAVIVLRSIYRADKNLHVRNVNGLEYSPGWCVGWFFIPIASLWKPYQAMKEIWVASHDPIQFSIERTGWLPAWWTLFVISNFSGTSSARAAIFDRGPDSQAIADVLSSISTIASIPEALILLVILRQIAVAQDRTLKFGDLAATFS